MISRRLQRRFEKLVRKIPKGKVTTYGILAKRLGIHPRTVGILLKNNKDLVKIPCYRVVYSDGRIGGYSRGIKRKVHLLKRDGIKVIDGKIDLKRYK